MNQAIRFKLNVQLTITKELGYDVNGKPLESGQPIPDQAFWRDADFNNRLSINEDLNLGSLDFAEAMRVMVQLHDTLEGMRSQ